MCAKRSGRRCTTPWRMFPSEHLTQEKTEVYNQLAELNRQIRAERKKLALCREIQTASKQMEEDIRKTETRGKEVEHDEHRRR